jgi:hypothetical protein
MMLETAAIGDEKGAAAGGEEQATPTLATIL